MQELIHPKFNFYFLDFDVFKVWKGEKDGSLSFVTFYTFRVSKL